MVEPLGRVEVESPVAAAEYRVVWLEASESLSYPKLGVRAQQRERVDWPIERPVEDRPQDGHRGQNSGDRNVAVVEAEFLRAEDLLVESALGSPDRQTG